MTHLVSIPEGESGPWRVSRFEVKKNDFAALHYALHGRPVPPGTYTRLTKNGRVIMSDTPSEWHDLAGFVRCAEGKILVTGLGLGMLVNALLAKEKVSRVVVVEWDADVHVLVAKHLSDKRLRIVHADAFTWKPDEKFDYAWHDIWPDVCGGYVPEMGRLRHHYRHAMTAPKRQFCWCEYEMRRGR